MQLATSKQLVCSIIHLQVMITTKKENLKGEVNRNLEIARKIKLV